jgi:hypothetical protein
MSDFSGMTKHVGMLNNTGKNVVVVYMRLPGDPNHSLVIDTDALPDNYNDALRRLLESTEGQQATDFADVLARRMSPDGSNLTLLQKFHQAQRLQKVPVNLITMTPRKGIRWPLTEVIKAMDAAKEDQPVGFDDLDAETRAALAADLKKFNVHASNISGEASANRKEEAVGLIRQAELMEADAQNMRLRAYKMDPALKPKTSKSTVDKTVHFIDVGDLQPAEAATLVEQVKKEVQNKSQPTKATVKKKPTTKKQ